MRVLTAILLAVLTACSAALGPSVAPSFDATATPTGEDLVRVVRVVDGDTIVVAIGGPCGTKVRLIGIDTPERDECFYRAATDRMRTLVDGKSVKLVHDVSETDRYGRLLRYVYDGARSINAMMVSEGFANAATYPPDVAHALEYVALERKARLAGLGLWSKKCFP
ncbi:MAG: thermonuclease family protein [Actinomycetota bacterium]